MGARMNWAGEAILCSVLPHGEHGAIARVLTEDAGLLAGYVRAGRSTKFRAMLMPGNRLRADWHLRVESQLGALTVDLTRSRAASYFINRAAGAAMAWATGLVAASVPERLPYPGIFMALDALLETITHADTDIVWAAMLVRYEMLVLAELGFGLDLASCAATGALDSLVYVSPKSAQAVSRAAGEPFHEKLLPLPAFLLKPDIAPGWADVYAGLRLTGYFLERHVLVDKAALAAETRQRLVTLLPRSEPIA
jgi:DNA repair protein RecO (recombination protein O)